MQRRPNYQDRRQQQPQHNPIEQLAKSLGKTVLIKVKRDRLFSAKKLLSFDQHLNLYLEGCTQLYEVENDKGELEEVKEELGNILIRGDNIIFIEFGQ